MTTKEEFKRCWGCVRANSEAPDITYLFRKYPNRKMMLNAVEVLENRRAPDALVKLKLLRRIRAKMNHINQSMARCSVPGCQFPPYAGGQFCFTHLFGN